MTPNIIREIKYLKEKYGITNVTISKLLGCSRTSIYTYEEGGIPSKVHYSLIKLICMDQNYISDLALINKEYLTDKELETLLTKEQYLVYKRLKGTN